MFVIGTVQRTELLPNGICSFYYIMTTLLLLPFTGGSEYATCKCPVAISSRLCSKRMSARPGSVLVFKVAMVTQIANNNDNNDFDCAGMT